MRVTGVFPQCICDICLGFYSQGLVLQGMTICMTLHKGCYTQGLKQPIRNLVLSLWAEISVIILSASSELFLISNQTTYILSSLASSLKQAKSVITYFVCPSHIPKPSKEHSFTKTVTLTSDTQGSPSLHASLPDIPFSMFKQCVPRPQFPPQICKLHNFSKWNMHHIYRNKTLQ